MYEIDDVTSPPSLSGGLADLIARVRYPEPARADGTEGIVVVMVAIGTDGVARSPLVLRDPDPRLSEAATAILSTPFEPGQLDGQSVTVRMAIPITFRLR